MGRRRFVGQKRAKVSGGEGGTEVFDGQKPAKLGTEKNPAVVHVQTKKRLKEVASVFEEHGWKYSVALEPDKPEDITDLERLLNPPKPVIAEMKVGRNEPCPCGSGKKYKKCCGAA
ncbi:MAG: PBPRA1643 family SWIM/SEC-C metal-binding motif protein [Thermodesulfobacteriota bacterium]